LQLQGILAARQGSLREALALLDRALLIRPDQAEIHYNRGIVLDGMDRPQDALRSYEEATRLNPGFDEAWFNQGALLHNLGCFAEALAAYQQLSPAGCAMAELHNNRGVTLKNLDRFDEAIASYRRALGLRPDYAACYSNLLYLLAQYPLRYPVDAYLAEARGFERSLLSDQRQGVADERHFNPAPRQGRALRVGILSAELGQHAVAYFLSSWLGVLDSRRITLYLYPTRVRREAAAGLFQTLTANGHLLSTLDDAAAAERIRSDAIDILVDVSGHTEHNRLGILAHRAAPIQCHYIGFFASTGVREIDYFLADDVLIPPELDAQFTETVWRLPRPWLAYCPLENAPEPGWQAPDDGTVCLGSFNNLVKVRAECLDLWARVMRVLPEAWLLLKDGKATDPATQQRIRDGLARRGVDVRKIAFAARTADWQAHMALYDQVDIALDTIPLNSGTTAFDALWMGVPLITLAGNTMAGRMGAAILSGLGYPEWIARDETEFVDKVQALARNLPLRMQYRAGQRERMRNSPLCDGTALARALEDAFETLFDRHFPVHRFGDGLEQALGLHRQGRVAEAEVRYRALLRSDPAHFDTLQLLGTLLAQRGALEEALTLLDRALLIQADRAEIHYNRGIILQNMGHLEQARMGYRDALSHDPHHLQARNNLGLVCERLGDLEAALESYERVLALKPDYAEVHCNKGNVLRRLERLPEAQACYEQATRLNPGYAEAWHNLANSLKQQGQLEQARRGYEKALGLDPDHAEARFGLGNVLNALGCFDEAMTQYEAAIRQQPDTAETCNDRISPKGDRARPDRSGFADVQVNQGNLYKDMGRLDAAEASYRQALSLCPHHPLYRSNLLFLMAYCPERQSLQQYRDEAIRWEIMSLSEPERCSARARHFVTPSRQGRPLRVGVLSAEFSQHAVACFLNAWLGKLDRRRFRLFLYSTRPFTDDKTRVFKARADVWCPLHELDDESAAARIRSDQIDILIETSGHTANNRLGIVARRVAPVQCHYTGYFATTGLTEMDYFLADEVLVPASLDDQFVERVWRLPRPWLAYAPLEEAPRSAWQPSPAGRICLGSFNNLVKVREPCLELWARVLKALPEAWLLLKDGRALDESSQHRIREALFHRGVEAERVVFAGRTASWPEHMALYDQVDIALDTLPLNSGTTAFDALWMGVPLITLAGDHLAGRMGAAIVTGMGQADWVARDADDYIARVVALARDVPTRVALRHTQRERMQDSLLCDGVHLADILGQTFEHLFDLRTGCQ
ncbi:tetratricopeptide repeat protein, partial [Candidatus Woesearchaeota archaeon]|nr:tetratricopeptide repeat protein [Candidatus Woesearchaeota archaeon]